MTSRARLVFLLLSVASSLVGLAANAANYTVATSGTDTNPGSAAQPWRTLQHAADQVVAGDSVTVLAGTYVGFALGWSTPQNGTPAQPIVFTAQAGVLINQPNSHTADGIDLEGSSYVTVQGFEVTGVSRAGIRAVSNGTTNADGVVLRNNYCHDNGEWGIFTSHDDNILVEGNRTSNSQQQHGIYISNASVGPVVRGNTSWGNHAAGIHMNGDASQGGTGIIAQATVERNIIHDNGVGGGSGINCDGVQQSRIQNNLIYAEHASGISLYRIDAAQPATNNIIVNNTIVIASDGRWALNIQNASTGNAVYNNILFNLNPAHGSIDISTDSHGGLLSDYNIVVDRFTPDDSTLLTLAAWRMMTGSDSHSLVATSAAVFVGGTDYHLAPGSPAIGTGTATDMPPIDLEGSTRSASSVDIGAYVFAPGVIDAGGTPADSGSGGDAGIPTDATSPMNDVGPTTESGGIADVGGPGADVGAEPGMGSSGERSGCGCRTATAHTGPSRWLAVALALGWWRRRRGGHGLSSRT
jgi:parallel beta-helix repeat protein